MEELSAVATPSTNPGKGPGLEFRSLPRVALPALAQHTEQIKTIIAMRTMQLLR